MCTVLEVVMFIVLGVVVLNMLEEVMLLATGTTNTVAVARTYDTIAGGVELPTHTVVPSCTEK